MESTRIFRDFSEQLRESAKMKYDPFNSYLECGDKNDGETVPVPNPPVIWIQFGVEHEVVSSSVFH